MLSLLLSGTVLLLGDSHSVGPFGQTLDKELRGRGLRTATYASCGSIAQHWETGKETTCGYFSKTLDGKITQLPRAKTPALESLLKEVRPDYVIVELVTNYALLPSDSFAIKDMKKLVEKIKISGAKCFWVGAPDMRRFRNELPRFRRLVEEAVGSDCEIFDSETVTNYPASGGDGIHYWSAAGTPIAQSWAREVASWFEKNVDR